MLLLLVVVLLARPSPRFPPWRARRRRRSGRRCGRCRMRWRRGATAEVASGTRVVESRWPASRRGATYHRAQQQIWLAPPAHPGYGIFWAGECAGCVELWGDAWNAMDTLGLWFRHQPIHPPPPPPPALPRRRALGATQPPAAAAAAPSGARSASLAWRASHARSALARLSPPPCDAISSHRPIITTTILSQRQLTPHPRARPCHVMPNAACPRG